MPTTPNFNFEVIDEHHSKVIVPLQEFQYAVDDEMAALITATTGSVIFAGASGTYTQDNSNLFWDDTNNRLGIGTNAPAYMLHIKPTNSYGFVMDAASVTTDCFIAVGLESTSGPSFNFGYSGSTFGRGSGFFNVRPDASAVAPNPSIRFLIADNQKMILDNLGNLGLTGTGTFTKTSIGSTSTDGLVLENTTAATSGNQQWSPRIRLSGKGWGGTSQAVDFKVEVVPVQGSTSETVPHSYLAFKPQINGAGYSNFVTFHSSGSVGIGLTSPHETQPGSADPPVRWGRLAVGPLTGHGHMGGSYPFPHGRAIVNIDDEYNIGFDLESTNTVNKVVGISSWCVLNPTENMPTGGECYGGRHVIGIKAGSTRNFYDIAGADGLAYHDGSGSARYIMGGSFEAQTAGSGDVTQALVGVHAKVRELPAATGDVLSMFGTWNEITLNGDQVIGSIVGNNLTITVAGNSSATTQVAGFYMDTPVFTSTAAQPYIAFLQGLRIPDLSQFGAKVLANFNIRSLGLNSTNLFVGSNYAGYRVFGEVLATDTATSVGHMRGQSAYAQATTNTSGADILLAGGTGRRFFTVVDITLGNTILTMTVNGSAVTLEGSTSGAGVQFAYGATTTTAATNLAAAINANSTLNVQVTAASVTDKVYLTMKGRCYSLTIATNQVLRISTTSGADAGIKLLLEHVPVYANNAAAVAGGLAVGRFYRSGADPDGVSIVH